MAIPVNVTLDRGDLSPLDLTPMIEPGSLNWSSVVPGGFASCSFQVNGDFRRLLKLLPYLAIVRVVGDSGRVLFEGQIEDLSPTLSENTVGIKVGAFGLQNALKEDALRGFWSRRDMAWDTSLLGAGVSVSPYVIAQGLTVQTGQFDPTNPTLSGVKVLGDGSTGLPNSNLGLAEWIVPEGVAVAKWLGFYDGNGVDTGSTKYEAVWFAHESGAWVLKASSTTTNAGNTFTISPSSPDALAVGAGNFSGATYTPAANDWYAFYDMRMLGLITSEDVADSYNAGTITFGGFYGDTLIKSILSYLANDGCPVGAGVIEPGTDFTIDHLDASVRRTAYDLLTEIAGYYSREWAVWENGLLNWTTPQLSQPQWIVPLGIVSSLDLDASVQNSQQAAYVLFTDAASGATSEAAAASTDRRNPYVLRGRAKKLLNTQNLPMTSNTAQQLAKVLLNDLGFGPVPAAGTLTLPGETVVSHASGSAKKAWEIRAGDNVTIPELPLADVFTQDGRGECLFHIVSAEADSQSGNVTLTLDSYGSKRSDVLLARLAAVTSLLGG